MGFILLNPLMFSILLFLMLISISTLMPKFQNLNIKLDPFEMNANIHEVKKLNIMHNDYTLSIKAQQILMSQNLKKENHPTPCRLSDPQLQMIVTEAILFQDEILSHYSPQDNSYLVLRTQKQIKLYHIDFNRLLLKNSFQIPKQFKNRQTFFIKIQTKLVITDGYECYQITNQNIRFIRFIMSVEGNQPKKQFIQILTTTENDVILVDQQKYYFYKFNKQKNQFTYKQLKHSPQELKMGAGYIVDALIDQNNIYLLNNVEGIIQIFDVTNELLDKAQVTRLYMSYGEHLSFRKYGKVFEVVCKYQKSNFVAEMYLHFKKNRSKSKTEQKATKVLQLNRFYDKNKGVKDTALFRHQLFLFGDHQLTITGPAVNRHTLMEYHEFPYIINNHEMDYFYMLPKKYTDKYFKLLGISKSEINYVEFTRAQMSLLCQIIHPTWFRVQQIGTCCLDRQCIVQDIEHLCQFEQIIKINVNYQFHYLQALLITGVIMLILFLCGAACFCGCAQKVKETQLHLANYIQQIEEKRKLKSQAQKIDTTEQTENNLDKDLKGNKNIFKIQDDASEIKNL